MEFSVRINMFTDVQKQSLTQLFIKLKLILGPFHVPRRERRRDRLLKADRKNKSWFGKKKR